MAVHSGFMWIYPLIAWWFSTIMLVYQRVPDCSPQVLIWLDPNGFTVVCRDDFSTAASRQLRSTAGSFLCTKPWGQNQAMRETCAGIDHQILRPSWESHQLRLEIMKKDGFLINWLLVSNISICRWNPLPTMDNGLTSHAEELVCWPDLVGSAGSVQCPSWQAASLSRLVEGPNPDNQTVLKHRIDSMDKELCDEVRIRFIFEPGSGVGGSHEFQFRSWLR